MNRVPEVTVRGAGLAHFLTQWHEARTDVDVTEYCILSGRRCDSAFTERIMLSYMSHAREDAFCFRWISERKPNPDLYRNLTIPYRLTKPTLPKVIEILARCCVFPVRIGIITYPVKDLLLGLSVKNNPTFAVFRIDAM